MAKRVSEEVRISGDVAKVLTEELSKLVQGSAADLKQAAARISANAVAAASIGREDLLEECRDTARVLLEQNRIRAVDGSWTAIEAVIGGVLGTLASTLARSGGAL